MKCAETWKEMHSVQEGFLIKYRRLDRFLAKIPVFCTIEISLTLILSFESFMRIALKSAELC